MPEGMYRIGIVGANSLLGKELAEELQESLLAASDFLLFDDEEEASGQVAAVGDEPAVIQPVAPGSFDRMDFVFFTGSAVDTTNHWLAARKAGASIVDLADTLEAERGVLVRSPQVAAVLLAAGTKSTPLALDTVAVVSAHPAAVMLATVAARVQAKLAVRSFSATVVEPASQHGRDAMDELHQQTVNLLSFQTLPKDQYDAQVAFNLLPALGESASVKLAATEQVIARHYAIVGAGVLPKLDLELIQAPVFHGYVASVLLELAAEAAAYEVESALAGEGIDVVAEESDPPSNLSAAGQEDIMVRVKSTGEANARATRFFLWLAADNLKLTALNGIACANELKRLRPRGKVQ